MAGTYLHSVVPEGWYEGAPPSAPPTVDDAVGVLTAAARAV
jgi:hypothetical protein